MANETTPRRRPGDAVLSRRQLNRALLARQHVLDRADLTVDEMLTQLVGMQAQNPRDPYVALWSRLRDFEPHDLEARILAREAVRLPVMRTTLHLTTADDALTLRAIVQPVLERVFASSTPWARRLDGLDPEALLAAGREIVEQVPRTTKDLGMNLAARFPEHDPPSMAQAVRYRLPMVQIPPRGLWTKTGQPTWTTLEAWLGRPPATDPSIDAVVLRYLAAFGPATAADIGAWSGLTRLGPVVERLRPQLATFRDDAGRERFDLPDAPRPDEATPAPPRFMPEYDNLLLSHKDRRHVIPDAIAARLTGFVGTFLVDGFVRGQWRQTAKAGTATLTIDPFAPLDAADEAAVIDEAERLLAWHAPTASHRSVRFGTAR